MSRSGEIVVACDACQITLPLGAYVFEDVTLGDALATYHWRQDAHGRDVCPACHEKRYGVLPAAGKR